jgi:hypothetical protein
MSSPLLDRFLEHPLPVVFAGFYMYWMSRVLSWAMTLEHPSEAEWLVASVVAGGAAYFKFYTDLIMRTKD